MKRLLLCLVLLLFPVLTACNEDQVISTAQVAIGLADTFGVGAYTDVANRHAAGTISDVQWEKFLALYRKFDALLKTSKLSLEEYMKIKDKPLYEKIMLLVKDLDVITLQIKELLQAFGILKTPEADALHNKLQELRAQLRT